MRALPPLTLLGCLLLAGCAGGGRPAQPEGPRAGAPAERMFTPMPHPAPAPAGRPGRPGHLTAELRHATMLRAAPGGRALHRLRRHTEFGSPTVLAVVGQRHGWLRVLHPSLPNGRRGWIPARRAILRPTAYEIRIDRSARRAELRRGRRVVLRFPVAVGRPGNETPLGRFAVTDKLRPTERGSPYGCCALALTGHQPRLQPGWPGGDRLAIHGTPAGWSIGRPVSLGCLRAPTRALHRLMREVPLGTPVVIRR
jgi:hypothetical protein